MVGYANFRIRPRPKKNTRPNVVRSEVTAQKLTQFLYACGELSSPFNF